MAVRINRGQLGTQRHNHLNETLTGALQTLEKVMGVVDFRVVVSFLEFCIVYFAYA